jgi:hypothetical protein
MFNDIKNFMSIKESFNITARDIDIFLINNDISKILKESTATPNSPTDDGPPTFYKTFREYRKVSTAWLNSMFERTGWKVSNYILSKGASDPELDYTMNYSVVPVVSYGGIGVHAKAESSKEKYKKRQREINRELG